MAEEKTTKQAKEKNINAKGYRQNFVKGVVGWQDYLKQLRTSNNSQIALALLGNKSPVADKQTKVNMQELAKAKVKVPKGLQSRIDTVEKLKTETADTASFKKAIKKAINQLEFADNELTKELTNAIKSAVAKCSKVSKAMKPYC